MIVGCPERPLAMMPSLPAPVILALVTFSRMHVPTGGTVEAQVPGLKKLAMIPLAPTFWTRVEAVTENGVSRLLMPSLLASLILVLGAVNMQLAGTPSGLAGGRTRPDTD